MVSSEPQAQAPHKSLALRSSMGKITFEEVSKHNNARDCWVILYGKVYDLTEFLPEHPGGSGVIVKQAGKDATKLFDTIHPKGTIEKNLSPEQYKGEFDSSTLPVEFKKAEEEEERKRKERLAMVPPMSKCLNLWDMELVASKVLSPEAWAYYSSAADDMETYNENRAVFRRIWLRPRILRNVRHVDPSTKILGIPSALPFYITATALGRMGHPDGELNLTRAAARTGLIQMIPTLSSVSFDEMVDARDEKGAPVQFFQLYVSADRNVVADMLRRAEEANVKAIFVTVDAPQLGRREQDMRMHFVDEGSNVQAGNVENRDEGAARAISSFIDPSFDWDDVLWMKRQTHLPILLKGVQTWEDAVQAYEMGLAGVVLSNHGGRQLDFARSGVEVLEEVMRELRKRGTFPNPSFQIMVDGGFRRGTDILKAIAMGATAVGIGRPFLYAYSAYGVDGVVHAIKLLRDELEMNMRLIGAKSIEDLVPDMVDLTALHNHTGASFPKQDLSVLDFMDKSRL